MPIVLQLQGWQSGTESESGESPGVGSTGRDSHWWDKEESLLCLVPDAAPLLVEAMMCPR